MEVLNVREINKVVPLEETLIRQWINIEEYETLQSRVKELEAVKAENEILKTGVKVLQNALPDMCDFITDNRGICKEGCVYSQLCLAQKENGEIDILAMRKLAELLKGKEN